MSTAIKKPRKQEILEVAAQLFKEKGYAASTVRDIAEEVGIEAASLYNHISSKEALLTEICFEIANMFFPETDLIKSGNGSAISKIRLLIYLHIEITTRHVAMATVANNEWKHLKEPQLSEFLKMRDNYENCLHEMIKIGIEEDELRKIDSTVALYTILSSIRWLQFWFREDRGVTVDQIKKEIADLLLNGIEK